MTSIMTALEPDHALSVISQPVDNFSLTFIAPLCADYDYVFCHLYNLIKAIYHRDTEAQRTSSKACLSKKTSEYDLNSMVLPVAL